MSGMTTEEAEEHEVHKLGERIGYGRIMQLAQSNWEKSLTAKGYPPGGAFVYGPCAAMTVPCGCNGSCDWCCGSGWLTEKVKEAKDQGEKS